MDSQPPSVGSEGDMKHGITAYTNHGCRCEVCRRANTAAVASRRASVSPADARTHGTLSAYTNYNCRCAPCREAERDYMRDYRRRVRERRDG